MTDAEYLFKQTSVERKRIGRGDRNKKRRGGKTVRFPSDNLSRKEKMALNGEVKTYKERPFYTREEFQALPDDLQVKWINSVINRYDVSVRGLSKIVFGSHDWLRCYINSKGYREYINKGPIGRAADKGIKALTAAYEVYKNGAETVVALSEVSEAELHTEEPEMQEETVPVVENSVEMQSEPEKPGIDAIAALVNALQGLAGTGAKLTIEIVL